MGIIKISKDHNIFLKISKSIYDRQAILKTAYAFTDTCHIHVDSFDADNYAVYFSGKNDNNDLESIIKEFCNELIDQQIRHDLNDNNKAIKELIIKKAFFPFLNDK